MGTKPSLVILKQNNVVFKKIVKRYPKVPNPAKAKRDDVISPPIYKFH